MIIDLFAMPATPSKKRLVTCPQCKAVSEYSVDNKSRPFCSERCRLMDLGQWASESYRIPASPKLDDLSLDNLSLDDLGHSDLPEQ